MSRKTLFLILLFVAALAFLVACEPITEPSTSPIGAYELEPVLTAENFRTVRIEGLLFLEPGGEYVMWLDYSLAGWNEHLRSEPSTGTYEIVGQTILLDDRPAKLSDGLIEYSEDGLPFVWRRDPTLD